MGGAKLIVVDTSAILAILLREERSEEFARRIEEDGPALVSAGNAIELATVASRDPAVFDNAMAFLNQPFVRVEPVDAKQVAWAQEAYRRFGRGHHPARLNFGDTFAYALARHRNLPLLFQGNDFVRTDIAPAANEPHSRSRRDRDGDDEPSLIQQRVAP